MFKKVSYKDIQNYLYSELKYKGALLTCGDFLHHNTMTIGWGTPGVLWSKDVYIAYIKPTRYTYDFANESEYFTVSFFLDKPEVLSICGTKSGRDVDKDALCHLTPIEIDQGIAYEEAQLIVVLKKIYQDDFRKENFLDQTIVEKRYQDDLFHRFYVGEVVAVYQNNN